MIKKIEIKFAGNANVIAKIEYLTWWCEKSRLANFILSQNKSKPKSIRDKVIYVSPEVVEIDKYRVGSQEWYSVKKGYNSY